MFEIYESEVDSVEEDAEYKDNELNNNHNIDINNIDNIYNNDKPNNNLIQYSTWICSVLLPKNSSIEYHYILRSYNSL